MSILRVLVQDLPDACDWVGLSIDTWDAFAEQIGAVAVRGGRGGPLVPGILLGNYPRAVPREIQGLFLKRSGMKKTNDPFQGMPQMAQAVPS